MAASRHFRELNYVRKSNVQPGEWYLNKFMWKVSQGSWDWNWASKQIEIICSKFGQGFIPIFISDRTLDLK